jgi:hypothetical protein
LPGHASRFYELASTSVPAALSAAARSAWYANERQRALKLFARAVAQTQATAQTRFLYGEALRFSGDREAAGDQYRATLELSDGKNGREDKRLRVLALARLGRLDEAEAAIGRDEGIRADYASVLLDEERQTRTSEILRAASRN